MEGHPGKSLYLTENPQPFGWGFLSFAAHLSCRPTFVTMGPERIKEAEQLKSTNKITENYDIFKRINILDE